MLRFDPFGDGYTEPGFIAALLGQPGPLRFTFRPALVEESRRLSAAAEEMTTADYDREAAKFTSAKIVDWDFPGHRPPVTPAALLRLPGELFARLHEINAGWAASDVDRDWPAEVRERAQEIQRVATDCGRSVGEVREERGERSLVFGVNLILFHPRVLDRSCQSCQQWMYDDQHRLVRRLGEPVPRPVNSPTPCWKCPKRSPENAAGLERDLGRIQRTLHIYFETRATQGRSLSSRQAADSLLTRHLTLVDLIVRRLEANKSFIAEKRRSR